MSRPFTTATLLALATLFTAACQSDPGTGSNTSTTVVASLQSVATDSLGTHITLAVRNSGDDTITVGSYCPGTLQVARAGSWVAVTEPARICPASAAGINPGESRNFTVSEGTTVTSGSRVRYVVSWALLDAPGGGTATTAAYTIQ